MHRDDDEAWRSIVENFGERAHLAPEEESALVEPRTAEPRAVEPAHDEDDDVVLLREEPDDAFVPPTPPPIPRPPNDRLAAWLGVLGAPTLLLACTLLGVGLTDWQVLLLAAAFVGGFAYLVIRMPREPRDPWDDGAVV